MSSVVEHQEPLATPAHSGWVRDPLVPGLFAVALVYVLAIYLFHFERSICPEFLEHGSAARNLLRTQQLRGTYAFPGELAFLHERGHTYDQGWPITIRSRAYVILVAGSMLAFGQNDFAVYFPSALSYALCVPILYLIGRDVFSRSVGVFAALFYLFTPNWIYVFEGAFRDCTFSLLLLIQYRYLFHTLFQGRATSGQAAVIGLSAGAAWLVRPDLLFFLPTYGLAFYLYCPGTWFRRLVFFTLAYAVAVLPVYGYCWTRREPVSLPYVQALVDKVVVRGPEHPLDRYQSYRPSDVFPSRIGGLISKWPDLYFREYIPQWFNDSGSIWITACFIAGMFARYPAPQMRLLWFAISQLVLHLGMTCFILYSGANGGRYYIWFSALALVYGVYHLQSVAGWLGTRKVAAILCLFLAFDVVAEAYEFTLYYHARNTGGRQTYYPLFWATGTLDANYSELPGLIPEGAVVMADRAQEIAWYVDRPAAGIPWDLADIEPILEKEPVDYLYLRPTPRFVRGPEMNLVDELDELRQRLGWKNVARFSNGATLFAVRSVPDEKDG